MENDLRDLLVRGEVLVRLQAEFADLQDARDAFLCAVNMSLRFCPNVAVELPPGSRDLLVECDALATGLHGAGVQVRLVQPGEWGNMIAILNIGTEVRADLPWTTVNSSGWVARAVSGPASEALPYTPAPRNALGAIAAASIGAWPIFARLLGVEVLPWAGELSLLTGQIGALLTSDLGPDLPSKPMAISAWVIGCGAVTNGWAYAIKRLPVRGYLEMVDREAIGFENLGPYMVPRRASVGTSKASLLAGYLTPEFEIVPRPEELEFFRIRLRHGLEVPSLVINGLDDVEARHTVQQLWPESLIDMAAGGTTVQNIVWHKGERGLCLLSALTRTDEGDYADRLAAETGLSARRIRLGPTTPVTEADVASAPEEKRRSLEAARRGGQVVCGRVTDHLLAAESIGDEYAPAVPFVTGMSGVVGAAETMKWLLGISHPHHFQFAFASMRSRSLHLHCDSDCDCQGAV